jgi:hypothetical protein
MTDDGPLHAGRRDLFAVPDDDWIVRTGADDFAALADYSDEYMPGARRSAGR